MIDKEYQKAIENIHAPEELKRATVQKMLAEKNKHRYGRKWWVCISAAACLSVVILAESPFFQKQEGGKYITTLKTVKMPGESIGVHTGKIGEDKKEKDIFLTEIYQMQEFIPEELWRAKPSLIHGYEIYVCYSEDTETYYAAMKKDGKYVLFTGEKTDKDRFWEYLENYLEEE